MTPSLVDHYRWRVRDLMAEMDRELGEPAAPVAEHLGAAIRALEGILEANYMGGSVDDKLEWIMKAVRVTREKRETELREAARSPEALMALINRDSAGLAAAIGGYACPSEYPERDEWIREKMRNDPAFVWKARAVANLIHEYTRIADRSGA